MPASASAASVRLGNVVGGGDEADRLVPNALRAFRAGEAFTVRDPAAKRPFQHVLDITLGMSRLASALLNGSVQGNLGLNFAPPNTGSSAGELVEELARAWGVGAIVSDHREVVVFPEQQVIQLDGSKATRLVGWDPHLDLASSASWTVTWAKMADNGLDPAVATSLQVSQYLDSLLSDTEAAV